MRIDEIARRYGKTPFEIMHPPGGIEELWANIEIMEAVNRAEQKRR